jgi:tetratricopeptide (TPR) repeat protein
MGIALTRLGQVEKAITHWKQAVQIDPHYADAHYNLGVALERTGNVGDAIEQYEQTLRIKPDYAEAQKKLARLQSAQ